MDRSYTGTYISVEFFFASNKRTLLLYLTYMLVVYLYYYCYYVSLFDCSLSSVTNKWVSIEDGHAFEGILVRDLLRSDAIGLPKF